MKVKAGNLNDLLDAVTHGDIDDNEDYNFISEQESYEPSRVRRTKMKVQDRMDRTHNESKACNARWS